MIIRQGDIRFLWMTENPLKTIENAARVCYKSEGNICEGSDIKLVTRLIKSGHEAMLEHASVSYKVICDRGISHEIVRHRLFSFAQESTRYCDYNDDGLTFIAPPLPNNESRCAWLESVFHSAVSYYKMRDAGSSPQLARSVLPTSLKTELVITGNLRQWRTFFKLRCAKTAHPQMRELACILLNDIKEDIPVVFDDIQAEKPEKELFTIEGLFPHLPILNPIDPLSLLILWEVWKAREIPFRSAMFIIPPGYYTRLVENYVEFENGSRVYFQDETNIETPLLWADIAYVGNTDSELLASKYAKTVVRYRNK